jgi:hypothetical protein
MSNDSVNLSDARSEAKTANYRRKKTPPSDISFMFHYRSLGAANPVGLVLERRNSSQAAAKCCVAVRTS